MGRGHAHVEGHGHGGHDHPHDHDHDAEVCALRATTLVVGLLIGLDLLLGATGLDGWRRPFGVPLALVAAVIGGARVVFLALGALFEGRVGADIALAIACVAAGLLGEYFVAAEVVFIALVGECLEAFTFERARRSIQKVLEYRPKTARVVRDGGEVEVDAASLVAGDVLAVRPGERVAADGVVVAGRSAVDQSVLTGEGLPVDKGVGDPVFNGTLNRFGRLEVRAEKVGGETTLGQVIRLLGEAQARKSPLERAADRYARRFLPAVLTAALVVFLATNAAALWGGYRAGKLPSVDLMPALAVLVVACPCALILATPAAVLAATARLARRGVIVKGGAAIERLARVDAVAFDKTGTLTEGRPEVGDVTAFAGASGDDVLRLAAGAGASSEHPLARLLVAEAARRGLERPETVDFEAKPGAGVVATVRDENTSRNVLLGNLRLVREEGVDVPAEVEAAVRRLDDSGQTTLLVAADGQILGAVGARDRVRPEAHDVIHDLKRLGLKDLTILTGDRAAPALAAAKRVHLKRVEAGLTPAGKAAWVEDRRREGRVVAMVGDGVNDAPALATADVGIAIAGAGNDLAAEAGSVVLLGAPLEPLAETFRVARQTARVIRQNILIFAFGLNGVAVGLAGLRLLGPVGAAVLHQVGSLLVLLNAVRLLGFDGLAGTRLARASGLAADACRACRPSHAWAWAWTHRRRLAAWGALGASLLWAVSGLTVVSTGEVGVVRRFGRFRPPLLKPGLHARWPAPVEVVTRVEPGRVRVARVGLSGRSKGSDAVAWGAAHGAGDAASSLFFTGDENLVELSGVVEYRWTEAEASSLLFGVGSVEGEVASSAEAAFRESAGRAALDEVLAEGRRDFEAEVGDRLRRRLRASGVPVAVDRVRVVDAHPPRDVVPAYRDVAAAVSDAARYRNEAESYAAGRRLSALAEAQTRRDAAEAASERLKRRAEGERRAFLARASAHADRPDLTEFRLLWDALAAAYAGRPKLVLDPRAAGRRHVWLADPDRLGLARTLDPDSNAPGGPEN